MASVLVVDDEGDAFDAISEVARSTSRTVKHVRSSADAVQALGKSLPTVLFAALDDGDNLELIRVIRSYLRWGKLNVIVVNRRSIDLALLRELNVQQVLTLSELKLDILAPILNHSPR